MAGSVRIYSYVAGTACWISSAYSGGILIFTFPFLRPAVDPIGYDFGMIDQFFSSLNIVV